MACYLIKTKTKYLITLALLFIDLNFLSFFK